MSTIIGQWPDASPDVSTDKSKVSLVSIILGLTAFHLAGSSDATYIVNSFHLKKHELLGVP